MAILVLAGTIPLPSTVLGRRTVAGHSPNLVTLAGGTVALYDAAARSGIDLTLIDRIVAGRQPLPKSVAVSLAAALGVSVAELNVAAGQIVDDTGAPYLRTPIPPRPDLGETVRGATSGQTQAPTPQVLGFALLMAPHV